MKKKFPFWTLALIVSLIAIVNGAADYWHLYYYFWWLDIPMHLIGGFWVGLSVLALYYTTSFVGTKDNSSKNVLILSISSALFVGVGWELYEWVVAELTGATHINHIDTLSDICNDMIGAFVAAVIFIRKGYNTQI